MQLSAVIKYSVKQKTRPSFSYVLGLFRCAKEGTSVLRAMKIARKAEADSHKQFWMCCGRFEHSLDYCYYCVKSQQSNSQGSL